LRGMRIQVLVFSHLVTWPRFHRWTMDGIWRRARPIELSGRRASVLAPEDLVLYLCLQADNHGFFNRAALPILPGEELAFAMWSNNRLIRFTDIYETVRRHGARLDWDLLVEQARSAGIQGTAHASLTLTAALLGSTAPEAVLAALDGDKGGRLRHWIGVSMIPELGANATRSPRRALGKKLAALTPYSQIRLFRFVGLAEHAFPAPLELRWKYDLRRPSAVAAMATLRGGWSLLRTLGAFLSVSIARCVLGPWRSAGRASSHRTPLSAPISLSPSSEPSDPLTPLWNE
jgi:Uncharacterised nucleotidyltransferase